jgi:hypothetical protein
MKRKTSPLPDLDDDEFARRLKPLEAVMFQHTKEPSDRSSGDPELRQTDYPEYRPTGLTVARTATIIMPQNPGPSAAEPTVIRTTEIPEDRNADLPSDEVFRPEGIRNTEGPEDRPAGNSAARTDRRLRENPMARTEPSGTPRGRWTGVVGAAERLEYIEQTRGPKRRFEYLIPRRVGDALAKDAACQGKSATVLLLEVLRDAGYPVIPEDLIDLRKERRR